MGCCGDDREKALVKEVHKWHYIVRPLYSHCILLLQSLISIPESIRLQEFVMHCNVLVPVAVDTGYNRRCRICFGYLYRRQATRLQSVVQ